MREHAVLAPFDFREETEKNTIDEFQDGPVSKGFLANDRCGRSHRDGGSQRPNRPAERRRRRERRHFLNEVHAA